MRLIFMSDLHTYQPEIPDGDVLVVSGDISHRGGQGEMREMGVFLNNLPHDRKILIAGNHELTLEKDKEKALGWLDLNGSWKYLENEEVIIEDVKFWGSPYTPTYGDWAFMMEEIDLKDLWDEIPEDTDVVITHGPPRGTLDETTHGARAGSYWLAKRMMKINPSIHAFGHIHEARGTVWKDSTLYVNAAICNVRYHPVNKPIEVEIDIFTKKVKLL